MNILQKIFKDNYEIIQFTLHPRDVELENISKMIHCGDSSFGGSMYACSHCGNMKFVPFRCKSRFCPTCGVKYSQERSTNMSFKLLKCTHCHCVFTLDEELRIGPSFKKVKAHIYRKDKNGFYVYAKPNLNDPKTVIKYISRYLGRPVVALKRIDPYDGESVTFHYNRHEDDAYVERTLPAMDFIKLLIQHIPEKHFKMTRYYGLYARHREIDRKLCHAVHPSRHRFIKSFTKWRTDILLSFGYDPLKCPCCKHEMSLVEIYYNHKRVSLQELYERAKAKARCRSS